MEQKPLYWVGDHAVVQEDASVYGLVRKHILRRNAMPDVAQFVNQAPKGARFLAYMEDDGMGHLWIWWKDPSKARRTYDGWMGERGHIAGAAGGE